LKKVLILSPLSFPLPGEEDWDEGDSQRIEPLAIQSLIVEPDWICYALI
jgi:hypothetical protein